MPRRGRMRVSLRIAVSFGGQPCRTEITQERGWMIPEGRRARNQASQRVFECPLELRRGLEGYLRLFHQRPVDDLGQLLWYRQLPPPDGNGWRLQDDEPRVAVGREIARHGTVSMRARPTASRTPRRKSSIPT